MIFSALTSKLFGGLAVFGLVIAGVQTIRLSSAQSALENKRNELASCNAGHLITKHSLSVLQAELEKKNQESIERAKAYKKSISDLLKSKEVNDKLYESTKERIAKLKEQLGSDDGTCSTPDLGDL